jgi:hypothetical protein
VRCCTSRIGTSWQAAFNEWRPVITEEVQVVRGYADFVNGTLCFFVGVLWVALTCQWMPDKSAGVAIILLPFSLFVLAGTYLIARFRIKNLR